MVRMLELNRQMVGLATLVALCVGLPTAALAQVSEPPAEQSVAEQSDADADAEPDPFDDLSGCQRLMADYAASAARKLYRALSGQHYELRRLDDRSAFRAAVTKTVGEPRIGFQKDGKIAHIIDLGDRRATFAAAWTEAGPVIAGHLWPTPAQLAGGKACRPIASRTFFPKLSLDEVDIDPFKWWGMRIVWRIPRQLPRDVRATTPEDAVTQSLHDGALDGK